MNGLLAAVATAVIASLAAIDSLAPTLLVGFLPFVLLLVTLTAVTTSARRTLLAFGLSLEEDERSVASATLGLGFLSLSVFALACVGMLQPWAGSCLVGAFLIFGWPEVSPLIRSIQNGARAAATRPWLCLLIGLPLLLALWLCLVPPHQYDSLVYHLALPQEYIRANSIRPAGGMIFAHFPQNGEMLFTLALQLGTDVLAQMFMWCATVLTITWLLTFGRRVTPAAPWAAVLVATHTSILLMSSTTYVEPLVMLWMTAAVLTVEAFLDDRQRTNVLVLAAIFMGLALGTKYYAGLLAILLAGRIALRSGWKSSLIFSLIAGLVFAPWLVKNGIYAGNPVFPFLYKVFPATKVGWTSELAAGYFSVLTEYGHTRGYMHDFLALPVLLFRNPLRFGGGMDVLGDLGWDLTLWLWAAGAFILIRRREWKDFAVVSALYVGGWFMTGVVLRFLTAMAPVMALIGAAGVAIWRQRAGTAARVIAATSAGVMITAHLFLFLFVHGVFQSWGFLLSQQGRHEFLSRHLEYYPCAMSAASFVSPNDKILVVGEQRGYYIPRAHRASTVHAPNDYVSRLNEATSEQELSQVFMSEGYSHLLFVPREFDRLEDGLGRWTPKGRDNWKKFKKNMSMVYQGPGCVLAQLRGQ